MITGITQHTGVPNSPEVWSTSSADLEVVALLATEYSFDGGSTWQNSNVKKYDAYEEEVTVIAKASNGQIAKMLIPAIKIDSEPPEVLGIERRKDEKGNFVDVVTGNDQHSGIKEYSFDGGQTWQAENSHVSSESGSPCVMVRDYALTCSEISRFYISTTQSPAADIWTSGSVEITMTDASNDGMPIQEYSLDGGETWQEWQPSISKVFMENEEYAMIIVKDEQESTCMVPISITNIDKEAPEMDLTVTTFDLDYPTILANVVDTGSGVDVIKWAQGEQTADYFENGGIELTEDSEYSFDAVFEEIYTVYSKDKVGNKSVKTVVGIEPEQEFGVELIDGSTESEIYGGFNYLVENEDLAKYFVVLDQTPVLTENPEPTTTDTVEVVVQDENKQEELIRANLENWIGQVTLGTKIPLYDANNCVTAYAYNFSYKTKTLTNTPLTKTGHILVSAHTKDILNHTISDLSFDGQQYNSANKYYYFRPSLKSPKFHINAIEQPEAQKSAKGFD